jgi:hypothetical protein
MAAARGLLPVARDRDASVTHGVVAFHDHIGLHVRMARTRHLVALAGDKPAIVARMVVEALMILPP